MPSLPTSPRRSWQPAKRKQTGRKKDNQSVYNSVRWRRLRLSVIREYPLCAVCKSIEEIKEADVVDHLIPINAGGATWSKANLCPMCHSCHNIKSGKETHKGKLIEGKQTDNGLIPKDLEEVEKLFVSIRG